MERLDIIWFLKITNKIKVGNITSVLAANLIGISGFGV